MLTCIHVGNALVCAQGPGDRGWCPFWFTSNRMIFSIFGPPLHIQSFISTRIQWTCMNVVQCIKGAQRELNILQILVPCIRLMACDALQGTLIKCLGHLQICKIRMQGLAPDRVGHRCCQSRLHDQNVLQ